MWNAAPGRRGIKRSGVCSHYRNIVNRLNDTAEVDFNHVNVPRIFVATKLILLQPLESKPITGSLVHVQSLKTEWRIILSGNESCIELEEQMLNKYTCRPCVPLNFDGTLQYATPVCMLKMVSLGCTGIWWKCLNTILHIMSKHWNTCVGDILYV